MTPPTPPGGVIYYVTSCLPTCNFSVSAKVSWVDHVGYTSWIYIDDGSDDNLIQRYLIDEELIGMDVECIHPTAVTIMHPTGGKSWIHSLIFPSCIIIVHDLYNSKAREMWNVNIIFIHLIWISNALFHWILKLVAWHTNSSFKVE
jgi:hypothetical protein